MLLLSTTSSTRRAQSCLLTTQTIALLLQCRSREISPSHRDESSGTTTCPDGTQLSPAMPNTVSEAQVFPRAKASLSDGHQGYQNVFLLQYTWGRNKLNNISPPMPNYSAVGCSAFFFFFSSLSSLKCCSPQCTYDVASLSPSYLPTPAASLGSKTALGAEGAVTLQTI